jgi:hypothetical protein
MIKQKYGQQHAPLITAGFPEQHTFNLEIQVFWDVILRGQVIIVADWL